MKTSGGYKILVVDDHPMIREGIITRLATQADLEVCGEAASEQEAMQQLKVTIPDLVIVDILLKGGNGIDLIKRIKANYPRVKMLVLSGYEESLYAERALRAGASGYVNKKESNEKVVDAIRTVLQGEPYLSENMKQQLIARALGTRCGDGDPVDSLTDRELEIFRMIGNGLTSGAIAGKLLISPHTVDTHREKIKRKLGAKNAAELSRQAVQWVLEHG
jgi:DNA-binding NarL/FixJ family response regulator